MMRVKAPLTPTRTEGMPFARAASAPAAAGFSELAAKVLFAKRLRFALKSVATAATFVVNLFILFPILRNILLLYHSFG